jgi:hypothetical protein
MPAKQHRAYPCNTCTSTFSHQLIEAVLTGLVVQFHIFTAKCNSTDMLTFPHPEAVSIPDWAMTDYRGGATNISSA